MVALDGLGEFYFIKNTTSIVCDQCLLYTEHRTKTSYSIGLLMSCERIYVTQSHVANPGILTFRGLLLELVDITSYQEYRTFPY